jgi:hypothetical protein
MRALFPAFMTVCALLVVAGAAKVRSPSAASAALSSVRLPASRVSVRLLGFTEVATGAAAAVRPSPLTAGLVALAYGAFCAFVRLGRPVDCGCFGPAATGGRLPHALFNAVACSVAAFAAVVPPRGIASIVGQAASIAVPLSLGVAASAFAAYLVLTELPRAWHAYDVDGP